MKQLVGELALLLVFKVQSTVSSAVGVHRALGTSEPLGTATAPLAGAAQGVLTSALLTPSAHAPGAWFCLIRPSCNHTN